jgi:hypothetical protein
VDHISELFSLNKLWQHLVASVAAVAVISILQGSLDNFNVMTITISVLWFFIYWSLAGRKAGRFF